MTYLLSILGIASAFIGIFAFIFITNLPFFLERGANYLLDGQDIKIEFGHARLDSYNQCSLHNTKIYNTHNTELDLTKNPDQANLQFNPAASVKKVNMQVIEVKDMQLTWHFNNFAHRSLWQIVRHDIWQMHWRDIDIDCCLELKGLRTNILPGDRYFGNIFMLYNHAKIAGSINLDVEEFRSNSLFNKLDILVLKQRGEWNIRYEMGGGNQSKGINLEAISDETDKGNNQYYKLAVDDNSGISGQLTLFSNGIDGEGDNNISNISQSSSSNPTNQNLPSQANINSISQQYWKTDFEVRNINLDIYRAVNLESFDFDKSVFEYLDFAVLAGYVKWGNFILSNNPVDENKQSFIDTTPIYLVGSAFAEMVGFIYTEDFSPIRDASVAVYLSNPFSSYYAYTTKTLQSKIAGFTEYKWLDSSKAEINVSGVAEGEVTGFVEFLDDETIKDLRNGQIDLEGIYGNGFSKFNVWVPIYEENPGDKMKLEVRSVAKEIDWEFLKFLDFNSDMVQVKIDDWKVAVFGEGYINGNKSRVKYLQNLDNGNINIDGMVSLDEKIANAAGIFEVCHNIPAYVHFIHRPNLDYLVIKSDVTNSGIKLENIFNKRSGVPGFIVSYGPVGDKIDLKLRLFAEYSPKLGLEQSEKVLKDYVGSRPELLDPKMISAQSPNASRAKQRNGKTDQATTEPDQANKVRKLSASILSGESNQIDLKGRLLYTDQDHYHFNSDYAIDKSMGIIKLDEEPKKRKLYFAADTFDITKLNLGNIQTGDSKPKDSQFDIVFKKVILHYGININNFIMSLHTDEKGRMKGYASATYLKDTIVGRWWNKKHVVQEIDVIKLDIFNSGEDNYFFLSSGDASVILRGLDVYPKVKNGRLDMLCNQRFVDSNFHPDDISKDYYKYETYQDASNITANYREQSNNNESTDEKISAKKHHKHKAKSNEMKPLRPNEGGYGYRGTKASGYMKCSFEVEDLIVTENSFLVKLVSYVSVPGIFKFFMLDNNYVFPHIAGEFIAEKDLIRITAVDIEGEQFDFNVKGYLDLKKKHAFITGLIIPSFFYINTILRHMPVLKDWIFKNGLLFFPYNYNIDF